MKKISAKVVSADLINKFFGVNRDQKIIRYRSGNLDFEVFITGTTEKSQDKFTHTCIFIENRDIFVKRAKDLGFKTVPFKKIKDEKIKGRPGGLRPRLGGRQTGIPKIPKKRRTGYIPEAKERGKWKRLSKPLKSEAQATNLYRFVVDHSTSRRGRVREVEGVKKFGKRFAPSTSPLKFRKFRFKKGKKIPLKPRTEIEKTKFAIDT
ncbi:hypothetical protein LCGC14_1795710, partial [marine sediment metagenome]